MVRAGSGWRLMPHDLPPWAAVYQQTQRWLKAGVFAEMVHDLRELLRILTGRQEQPSAVILDSRTLQSTVESGHRAGARRSKAQKEALQILIKKCNSYAATTSSGKTKSSQFSSYSLLAIVALICKT